MRTAARMMLPITFFAAGVSAQVAPPPPPLPAEGVVAQAEPFARDLDLEPQVTIIRRDGETVEEVRIGGELRYVRVTPRHGRPYFLIPDTLGRQFIRRDSLDTALKPASWILLSW
ncbi:MAG TPA: DUF2782 domain-containing protein [Casimicrobiaceae bacterium]|nr:DUF2782 domain-containing protein [Casimicrobiaceae bacterium]